MPNQITYTDQLENLYQPATVGQTLDVITQEEIENQSYYISVRNHRNVYEVPIEKDKVYINFIAKKTLVTDSMLNDIDNSEFVFYSDLDLIVPEPEPFFLPDGILYRCLGEPLKDLRDYTYYVKENGVVKQLPDYKTVEVELAKRGISYTNVQVLTEQDCNDLKNNAGVEIALSQANSWNEELGNTTGYNTLTDLSSNLATLEGIISQLGSSAAQEQENIANDLAAQASAMAASEAAAEASNSAAGSSQSSAQAQASAAASAASAAQASAIQAQNAATATQAQADAALATTIAAQIALENAQNNN